MIPNREGLTDEQLSRIVIVRVPVREIMCYLFGQHDLPRQIAVCLRTLPEGFRVLGSAPSHYGGMTYDYIVQHDSFAPIAMGAVTPVWNGGIDAPTMLFALATEEEVKARVAAATESWRDRPSML